MYTEHTHAMPTVQAAGPTPAVFLAGCWVPHISLGVPASTGAFTQQWWQTLWLSSLSFSSKIIQPLNPYLFLHKSLLCISGATRQRGTGEASLIAF